MPNEQRAEISFGRARVVHVAMPPHEPDGYTNTSEPFVVGVSFTAHAKAAVEDDAGRVSELSFPAGSSCISGSGQTTWLRVSEPSEALEVVASPAQLESVAEELGVDWGRQTAMRMVQDPVIWGICARFRMATLGARAMEELEADALIRSLLMQVAVRHLDGRPPPPTRGRLDQRRLARVADLIESSLASPPGLAELAEVAAMSPFHFHRIFCATTGLTPHDYVMARRMEGARRLLSAGASVAQAAAQLGFSDLTHFRRSFRRHFNAAPAAVRGNGLS